MVPLPLVILGYQGRPSFAIHRLQIRYSHLRLHERTRLEETEGGYLADVMDLSQWCSMKRRLRRAGLGSARGQKCSVLLAYLLMPSPMKWTASAGYQSPRLCVLLGEASQPDLLYLTPTTIQSLTGIAVQTAARDCSTLPRT